MKKAIIRIVIGLLISMPLLSMAQTPIDDLYEKYAGKEGFTSINISPALFGMFPTGDENDDKDVKEMKDAINQITGMKILAFESKDKKEVKKFKDEVLKSVNISDYKEIMVVDSEDGGFKFLIKEKGDKIGEFLMLAGEDTEYTVMYFSGNMDLENIGKISKAMGVDAMEDVDIDVDVDEDVDVDVDVDEIEEADIEIDVDEDLD